MYHIIQSKIPLYMQTTLMYINYHTFNSCLLIYIIFIALLFSLFHSCSPHDVHRSTGPRPVKLCSDQ